MNGAPLGWSPWPPTLNGEPRRMSAFTGCAFCELGTWVTYGDVAYCWFCATAPAQQELVAQFRDALAEASKQRHLRAVK